MGDSIRRAHPQAGREGGRTIGKWQFDSLKVMLAFKAHLGIKAPEWTQADADALEQYCDALMQATCQMNAGQRKMNRN